MQAGRQAGRPWMEFKVLYEVASAVCVCGSGWMWGLHSKRIGNGSKQHKGSDKSVAI